MIPPPIAPGLIICEKVIVDKDTNHPSTIGIFNGLAVARFPSPPQDFGVFASLTNGRGDAVVRLVVNRPDTGGAVYEQRFPVRFPDPLLIANVRIRVRGIRFPVAGRYEFFLYVDSDPVAQRTLHVRSI